MLMKKSLGAAMAVLALAAMAVPAAWAQKPAEPLESRLVARKVVVADGKETLVEAANAKPGDVIEYVATYRNTGKDGLTGLQATMPIPPETEYIPGTARPAQAKASVDGRAFADIPLKRTVTRNGKQVEEQVPYREYRALRWLAGELGGGKSATFSARVKVADDRPPGEPGSKAGGT
jgi:uncharacterized repeat protein (TIGR01451 family)